MQLQQPRRALVSDAGQGAGLGCLLMLIAAFVFGGAAILGVLGS